MPPTDPPLLPPGDLARLGSCLRRSGLDEDRYRLGLEVLPGVPERARGPILAARLSDLGPAERLTALLAFGVPQRPEDLPREALAELDRTGFVRRADEHATAPWRFTPVAGLTVLSDHPVDDADRVMTPGVTTTELAWALPRPPGRRVLDVGTGSGVLGLLAAAQGAQVVATDLSPRACAFASSSAGLNGLAVDVRGGSLLEPVAGERFDLVVSQPPFIPRPDDVPGSTWLHGGRDGDELALTLLAGLPAVLAPGGAAVLRVDLVPTRSRSQQLQAVAGLEALDVVVVSWPGGTRDQIAYGYGSLEDPVFGDRYGRVATSYLRHLESTGVERVRAALVLVRRRSGGRPVVGDIETNAALRWDDLQARVAGLALAEEGDAALLRSRVAAPAGARVTWEQDLTGDLEVAHLLRHPPGGPLVDVLLDEHTSLLLQLAAGGRPVATLLAGFAEQLGQPVEEVAAAALARVRDALRRGQLLPTTS